MIRVNWQAEGSYFLGEFLYLQVSPQVRTKILLPITESPMEVPHSMLSIPSAPQTAGFIPATAALGGIAFPFQFRRGNKYTQLMQCLGQRLWDIPVSSEPSRNVSYNSGQKGRVPEKNLEFIRNGSFPPCSGIWEGCGDYTSTVTLLAQQ